MGKILKRVLGLFLLLSFSTLCASPDIQHWKTKNGMRVYFVPAPELPMLDVRVNFDAGSARDGEQSGIAHLTNGLLKQGAAGMDADAVATAFEKIGAQYGSGALRDMAWLSLRTLTDTQESALEIFTKVLSRPDFPEKDFARRIKQVLVSLEAGEADPGTIASKAWYKALYGDHPYATPMKGTKESVSKIMREDIRKFYQQFYVAQNGLVALTGDITRKQAEAIAEKLSAGLNKGETPPALPLVKKLEKSEEIRIPFPSEQAHVMIGAPGIERGNPDYYALYLGNHVLGGGGFNSQLVKEVRIKRGYAYSVYSYFLLSRQPGPYMIGLQTRVSQADDAVKVTRDTLDRFLQEGPGAEELNLSRKNITGGFPLRIASNSDIAEYLAVIGFYNLPLDYLDNFNGNIDAVTAEQIKVAYQHHVHPEKMITVIVGGPGKTATK